MNNSVHIIFVFNSISACNQLLLQCFLQKSHIHITLMGRSKKILAVSAFDNLFCRVSCRFCTVREFTNTKYLIAFLQRTRVCYFIQKYVHYKFLKTLFNSVNHMGCPVIFSLKLNLIKQGVLWKTHNK